MSNALTNLLKPLSEIEFSMGECFEYARREREARLEAETANHQKDAFLAIVAHELRNPLNSLIGWIGVLRCAERDESARARAVEAIERGVRLQTKLIEDLFDLSMIKSGKLRLNLQPIEITPLIENVICDAQQMAEIKQIRICSKIASDLGVLIVDSLRIEQVLWNLLSNAVKFTPNGGDILVRATRANSGSFRLKIQDAGRGIEPDFLPAIFEKFSQSEARPYEKQTGLGLGLFIVRQIVESHGGTVSAESEGIGKGTTFTVKLPQNSSCGIATPQML